MIREGQLFYASFNREFAVGEVFDVTEIVYCNDDDADDLQQPGRVSYVGDPGFSGIHPNLLTRTRRYSSWSYGGQSPP